jgi:hypothetical protein
MVKKLKVIYSNVNTQDKLNDLVRKIHRLIDDIAGPEEKEGKEIKHDFKNSPRKNI